MNDLNIRQWKDISANYTDTLLLGNGASVAFDGQFSYKSLYQEAKKTGLFNDGIDQLFQEFKTEDFELILRMVWQATNINRALGIKEAETEKAYKLLRTSLIQAVQNVHPGLNEIRTIKGDGSLVSANSFLKHFQTVLSLNYDAIVYWLFFKNEIAGNTHALKDCFNKAGFNSDWKKYRQPYRNETKTTLVFYPHGSLFLSQDFLENESKISANDKDLLNTITQQWKTGDSIPIFVSEGTSAQKIKAINNSHYLATVFHEVIPSLQETLVIYGWSLGDEDVHILNQLQRCNLKRIAVSVYMGSGSYAKYCEYVTEKIHNHIGNEVKIDFYDSASEGCWNNP